MEVITAVSADDIPLSGSRVDSGTRCNRTADDVGQQAESVARHASVDSADGIAVAAAVAVVEETCQDSICRVRRRSRYRTAAAFLRRSRRCIDDDGRTF